MYCAAAAAALQSEENTNRVVFTTFVLLVFGGERQLGRVANKAKVKIFFVRRKRGKKERKRRAFLW